MGVDAVVADHRGPFLSQHYVDAEGMDHPVFILAVKCYFASFQSVNLTIAVKEDEMGRTITILFLLLAAPGFAQETSESLTADAGELAATVEELNKELARAFYEDLWFSDNTDRYGRYLAEEYVVHDIGERKAVVEPAIEQKRIADFFHSRGRMTGSIDYQIAEGDLVATRWQWKFEPEDLLFRLLGG